MLELIIPGVPLPWKAPYVGCKGAFSVRTPIMNQIKIQLQNDLNEIFSKTDAIHWYCDSIAVDLIFCMSIPKATAKKKRELMLAGKIRPDVRPDRGNLLKLVEDVLQGVVIEDDSIIVDGRVAKYYSDQPKTIIRIYESSDYDLCFGSLRP